MRRLLKAIKCNQNCLDGSPRWLNNRQGNKGNLSADGPLVTPWTRPRATCSYDRTGCYFIAAAIIISTVILVKNWVHVCVRICPSVCFFAAVFVLVYMCVYSGSSWAQQDSILFSVPCCASRYEGINIWKAEETLCPQLPRPEEWQTCISCTFYHSVLFFPHLSIDFSSKCTLLSLPLLSAELGVKGHKSKWQRSWIQQP